MFPPSPVCEDNLGADVVNPARRTLAILLSWRTTGKNTPRHQEHHSGAKDQDEACRIPSTLECHEPATHHFFLLLPAAIGSRPPTVRQHWASVTPSFLSDCTWQDCSRLRLTPRSRIGSESQQALAKRSSNIDGPSNARETASQASTRRPMATGRPETRGSCPTALRETGSRSDSLRADSLQPHALPPRDKAPALLAHRREARND